MGPSDGALRMPAVSRLNKNRLMAAEANRID